MHRRLRHKRRQDERGAVALIVAFLMTTLLVITALVLDFGLVRIDRQIDRSAADAATMAGLYALNPGDGQSHPYAGVCAAVRYLKSNGDRFSTVNDSAGWTNGIGAATANGCTDTTLRNKVCKPSDKATWARWSWNGTFRDVDLTVTIESGYDLAVNNFWDEDGLAATTGDNGDAAKAGCDNLAVTITQSREPGLGTLATSSDLTTAVRSVGRVKVTPGSAAPAMLLLKRTGCPTLNTGSNAGSSWIRVYGAVSSDGLNRTQPGTIHSDSDGVGCNGSNNSWVYGGLANNGIVAYAAPQAANQTLADASKPGVISSYAVTLGLSGGVVRDNLSYVHGAGGINETAPGTSADVTGRALVTRSLVDNRYFTGVKGAITAANTVFISASSSAPAGWVRFPASVSDKCKPTQAQINALSLTSTSKLWIDCTANSGFGGPGTGASNNISIPAGTVYFRGVVAPSATLSLPNAHHVYVANTTDRADALSISNNTGFQVNNAAGNLSGTNCSTGTLASKSILFVRTGQFKQTGGTLRMCRTTAILMGGKTDGCVPATQGAAPMTAPCTGATSTTGTSQFAQTGGDIDWTAPDTINATQDASGNTLAAATTAWQSVDGPEDLALWSESFGSSSNPSYSMSGGGVFNVRGVFMMPNADPLKLSGSATLDLRNAQFIATSLALSSNNTTVKMAVDPNSAVTLPDQGVVGLVR